MNGAALILAVLTAAADPGARPATPSTPAGPSSTPAPSPAPTPAPAPPAVTPEVVAFIYPPRPGLRPRDGSATQEFDGPGQSQLRLSQSFLSERNEELQNAEMLIGALMQAVNAFYTSSEDRPAAEIRKQFLQFAGPSLDEARTSLLSVVELEGKRLAWVRKAAEVAAEQGAAVPEVDRDLVERRVAFIASGKAKEAVEARIRAYRNLATGLVAYLDGDPLTALEKIKSAAREGPEIALAHAYLGSLYYLFQQVDQALAEWKKAVELDPKNDAARQALKDHFAERK